MNSRTTKRFRNALSQLPDHIQQPARDAYQLIRQNHDHPSLRFRKVHATQPIYSARISRDYRAVGVVDGEDIIWFWIGSHSEYDKLLKQL